MDIVTRRVIFTISTMFVPEKKNEGKITFSKLQ